MVDVEQHALRAFEQDAAAAAARLVEVAPYRLGERQHEIGDLGEVVQQPLAVDRRLAEAGAERVVVRAQAVEQRAELAEMREVADADRAAADLVLVGRADAAPRRADLARAATRPRASASRSRWIGRISGQVSAITQHLGRDLDALLAHALDLGLRAPRGRAPRRCR